MADANAPDYRESLDHLEKMLSARSVVGDPIEIRGSTVIPLVSTGFGFGAGGGNGPVPNATQSAGGAGTGAGGGVRPVALIIADENGVRVERLTRASALESLGNAVGRAMESRKEG